MKLGNFCFVRVRSIYISIYSTTIRHTHIHTIYCVHSVFSKQSIGPIFFYLLWWFNFVVLSLIRFSRLKCVCSKKLTNNSGKHSQMYIHREFEFFWKQNITLNIKSPWVRACVWVCVCLCDQINFRSRSNLFALNPRTHESHF